MVKIEEFEDIESTSNLNVEVRSLLEIGSSSLALSSSGPLCKKEIDLPSSSSGHLKSYFVGMGFSPTLVDRVLENGEEDVDALLEALIARSALQKSSTKFLDSLDAKFAFDEEEDSLYEFSTCDRKEAVGEPSNVDVDKRSSLLAMKFSGEEVDLAINRLGENAPLPELVDLIIAAQTARSSGKGEEITTETLFETMNVTLRLLEMGFTEEEISSAIDNFGPEVPISELADSIFADRIARSCVKEEKDLIDDTERRCPDYSTENLTEHCLSDTEIEETKPSCSNANLYDCMEDQKGRMAKDISGYGKTADHFKRCFSATEFGDTKASSSSDALHKAMQKGKKVKHIPLYNQTSQAPELHISSHRKAQNLLSKPPYFFYGNVVDVSQETWRKMSQFLYGTEPEYANSQFFSAFVRKEGYLHNLPTENRFHIFPKPPMTIEDALPHTKRFWPSWDTRKQLSCINFETAGIARLCERLGKMMMDSRGIVPKEQQMDILHQCKTSNLIWVDRYRLSPIEPDQVERILGFLEQHTQISGIQPSDRLKALKSSFQTDTLGYHLSVLKRMYPSGLRVLSVFSGIGGAEVALSKLGIRLKCVVSIEVSEHNRKILRRWWQKSGQSGELKQLEGIERLTSQKIESLIEEVGGFDIIIGGNPCTYNSGISYGENSVGLDLNLFYEYVRVFQRVRSIMGRS